MFSNNQRPGVYSGYSISSGYASPRTERAAALILNFPADKALYRFENENAAALELNQAAQKSALCACRILFSSGVAGVYLLPMQTSISDTLPLIAQRKDIGCIIAENGTAGDLQALIGSVKQSSEVQLERLLFIGADTATEALNSAEAINHERGVVCAPACFAIGDDTARGLYAACAMAGAVIGESDPAHNFSTNALPALTDANPLDESEIQQLIASGVCVLEKVSGNVECVRAVTTRTTIGGEAELSMRPLNTILIIDDVMRSLRSGLAALLSGMRVGAASQSAIASQTTVLLAGKRDEGIIESFVPPHVRPDSADPSVCIVEISFNVAHVVEQIHLSAQIRI